MAGRIPLKIAVIAVEFFIRSKNPENIIMTIPGGKKIATVATQAPKNPATW